MKKAKITLVGLVVVAGFGMTSCKKCSECHYEKGSTEVEIGEYCGDDIEDLEAAGYYVVAEDTTYEAHCGEH